MTVVDALTLALLVSFVLLGAARGLVRDIFVLIGIVAGGYVAWRYGTEVANWVQAVISHRAWAMFLGYLLTFLAVATTAAAVGGLVSRLIHKTPLGWFDRLLGAGLGLGKGLLLVWVIVTGCTLYRAEARVSVNSSVLTSEIARQGTRLLGPYLRLDEPERKENRGRPVDRPKGPLVRRERPAGPGRRTDRGLGAHA
ncbi:CvpA family protein [candidate division WOR-3 bacterium]|nr:CvpA family protein [candidate division WOR-3 bacterium]